MSGTFKVFLTSAEWRQVLMVVDSELTEKIIEQQPLLGSIAVEDPPEVEAPAFEPATEFEPEGDEE